MSNKFLSFPSGGTSTSSLSTFLVESASKVLSIEIKIDDEFIELQDANESGYNVIQYKKSIQTNRDIIFTYDNLQKAKIYHHHLQTVRFHKFTSTNGNSTWIY